MSSSNAVGTMIETEIIMPKNTFAAEIDFLHVIYHQRISEYPFVDKNRVFQLLHVLYHQRTNVVLWTPDQRYDKQQEWIILREASF